MIFLGGLFGLLFALYEMIMGYVPMVWRWTPGKVFGEEFLITAAFHAAFFSVVSLPTLLFPKRLRGIEWICLYYLVAVAVITFLGSQRVEVVVAFRFISATFALATLYGGIKLWRSGGRVQRFGVVTASLIIGMIPFALIAFGSKVPQASEAAGVAAARGRPNILIVVYDTVNRHHLPTFGYGRDTAPVFDEVARQGVVFDEFYVTANWTVPVHGSLFTGKFSKTHGATHEHAYLGASELTLAEHLESVGYQTAGFSCNPWVGGGTGFDQGFQVFKEMWRGFYRDEVYLLHRFWSVYFNSKKDKGGALLVSEVKNWVKTADHARPYLMFLNLMEAHTPYHQLPDKYATRYFEDEPPPRSVLARVGSDSVAQQLFWRLEPAGKKNMEMARAMYDGGVYYDDVITGEVLETLETSGLLGNTIVILLSDHGELFGEHGLSGHEVSLYEPLVRTFMAVSWKGRIPKGLKVSTPVSVNDVFPTLDELIGLDGPPASLVQGRSIAPLIRGEAMTESFRVAESYQPTHLNVAWKYNHPFKAPPDIITQTWVALWDGAYKLVRIHDAGGRLVAEMLFDVVADSQESRNLVDDKPEDRARLSRLLDDWLLDVGPEPRGHGSSVPPLDEETKEKLRNLGYIGGDD